MPSKGFLRASYLFERLIQGILSVLMMSEGNLICLKAGLSVFSLSRRFNINDAVLVKNFIFVDSFLN